jgi:hypothetical protein
MKMKLQLSLPYMVRKVSLVTNYCTVLMRAFGLLANKIYHDREAAGDSSLQAQANIQHQAKTGHMAPDLLKEIKEKGGFTYNPRTLQLIEPGHETGFAIAVPHTEELI